MTATALTNSSASWKAAVTFHALDLNFDLVDSADKEISAESKAELEAQIASHWIFADPIFADRVVAVVETARAVHSSAGYADDRSDKELAARILQHMGLWDEPKPHGVWGSSRFLAKFLAAYGRYMFKAEFVKGRIPSVQIDNQSANHTPHLD